jgi:hypothetical protein
MPRIWSVEAASPIGDASSSLAWVADSLINPTAISRPAAPYGPDTLVSNNSSHNGSRCDALRVWIS